jgi:hypothetical protein
MMRQQAGWVYELAGNSSSNITYVTYDTFQFVTLHIKSLLLHHFLSRLLPRRQGPLFL